MTSLSEKTNTTRISPAFELLVEEQLSVRAKHTLQRLGVNDIESLLKLDRDELFATRHCGVKTAKEIVTLIRNIRAGRVKVAIDYQPARCKDCFPDRIREHAFNAVVGGLSCRGRTLLRCHEVESIEDFIKMPLFELPDERGIGRVTLEELRIVRRVLLDFLDRCEKIDVDDRLYRFCECMFRAMVDDKGKWVLDSENVYKSFEKWVRTIAGNRDKSEMAFRLRMGLNAEPASTLENAGGKLGITRERVRQLNKEFCERAEWEVHQRRLERILIRIMDIVDSNGGSIDKSLLIKKLSRDKVEFEKLSYAQPFLDYISSLRIGGEYGMRTDATRLFSMNSPVSATASLDIF